jgi:hypothetical protein
MALTTIPLPYGCRDIKIYPLTAGVPASTGIDLPNARTLQFAEAEAFTDLRGDDGLRATHGQGPEVDWSLESGGVSFEAVKAMYGGTVTTSGTTPAQSKKFDKLSTDLRPYFQIIGQAISDSGGDFTITLYKCKCTGDLTGTMGDGNFWLTGAKGKAVPADSTNMLYTWTQNETATTLA